MDIFFKCIHCDQRLVVDDAGVGMEIPCPRCQKLIAIPERSTVHSDQELAADEKVSERQVIAAKPVPTPFPPPPAEAPAKPPPAPRPPARVRPATALLSAPRNIQPARSLPVEPAPPPLQEVPLSRPATPPRPAAPLSHAQPPATVPPARALSTEETLAFFASGLEASSTTTPAAVGKPLSLAQPPATVPDARELSTEETLAFYAGGIESSPTPPRVPKPPAVVGKPAEPPAAPAPPPLPKAAAPPPEERPPAPAPVKPEPQPLPVPAAPVPPVPPVPLPATSPLAPPLDIALPDVALRPAADQKSFVTPTPAAVRLVEPPVAQKPAPPPPAPIPAQAPTASPPARGIVRLVDTEVTRRAAAEKWQELAAGLTQQLWNARTTYPLRAVMVETFLRAMPVLLMNPNVGVGARGAQAGMHARWIEPFTNTLSEHVARLSRATFEGSTARVAEVVELWMHHQQMMAERAGSNIEDISFSMATLPQSAVVTFGMNFTQRGIRGRKRVACWVGRIGDDLFVFSGKLPPHGARVPLAAERAFRADAAAPEPSVQIPRERILALPPPEGMDAAAARTTRELVINFCEAHFGRFDNRLAGEFYDGIRQDREAARAALPGVITAMPPSKEKRMLQQLYRDL